jgi:hypothetical protein
MKLSNDQIYMQFAEIISVEASLRSSRMAGLKKFALVLAIAAIFSAGLRQYPMLRSKLQGSRHQQIAGALLLTWQTKAPIRVPNLS